MLGSLKTDLQKLESTLHLLPLAASRQQAFLTPHWHAEYWLWKPLAHKPGLSAKSELPTYSFINYRFLFTFLSRESLVDSNNACFWFTKAYARRTFIRNICDRSHHWWEGWAISSRGGSPRRPLGTLLWMNVFKPISVFSIVDSSFTSLNKASDWCNRNPTLCPSHFQNRRRLFLKQRNLVVLGVGMGVRQLLVKVCPPYSNPSSFQLPHISPFTL